MKESTDPLELEKDHPTVSDSSTSDQSDPILSVRAGDIWTDFVRERDDESGKESRPRQNGTVPLLDDMTGIRQWE
jgi:hypothetical protein